MAARCLAQNSDPTVLTPISPQLSIQEHLQEEKKKERKENALFQGERCCFEKAHKAVLNTGYEIALSNLVHQQLGFPAGRAGKRHT